MSDQLVNTTNVPSYNANVSTRNVQIPDSVSGKMNIIIPFIFVIILIWLNNTGRLQSLINAFKLAGQNLGNGNINTPIDNPISPYPVTSTVPITQPTTQPGSQVTGTFPQAPPLPNPGSSGVSKVPLVGNGKINWNLEPKF